MTHRLLALACVVATSSAQRATSCRDEISAEQFTQAVDAAIVELQAQQGWFHNLRTSSGFTAALSISSCTADVSRWSYPPAAEAVGVLARVLSTGRIRVAGVQWGAYRTDPLNPSGFWPDYMQGIADRMAANYGTPIVVERVYYPTSGQVGNAVEAATDVDMSEPYYYLSGFHNDVPRIESLAHSCVTAGTASSFYTRKGSGITTTDELYDHLAANPQSAVGFIGQGNFDSVSAILPSTTQPSFVTDATLIEQDVQSGRLIAGYVSEGEANRTKFEVFATGIVSPRVALFRKDFLWAECADESGGDGDEWSTGELVALCVVSAIALVLTLLITWLIVKERTGNPVFMPIVTQFPAGTTTTTSDVAMASSKPQSAASGV